MSKHYQNAITSVLQDTNWQKTLSEDEIKEKFPKHWTKNGDILILRSIDESLQQLILPKTKQARKMARVLGEALSTVVPPRARLVVTFIGEKENIKVNGRGVECSGELRTPQATSLFILYSNDKQQGRYRIPKYLHQSSNEDERSEVEDRKNANDEMNDERQFREDAFFYYDNTQLPIMIDERDNNVDADPNQFITTVKKNNNNNDINNKDNNNNENNNDNNNGGDNNNNDNNNDNDDDDNKRNINNGEDEVKRRKKMQKKEQKERNRRRKEVEERETKRERLTETKHIENKITYFFDLSKVMFSAGNGTERAKAAHYVTKHDDTNNKNNDNNNNEIMIVDMFAGIGYFSVPLGVSLGGRLKKIVCLEKNPVSCYYLRKNLLINSVSPSQFCILNGDNRVIGDEYAGKCDHILMGYLPSAFPFLPRAFFFCKLNGNTTIHYHFLAKKGEEEEQVHLHFSFSLNYYLEKLNSNHLLNFLDELKPPFPLYYPMSSGDLSFHPPPTQTSKSELISEAQNNNSDVESSDNGSGGCGSGGIGSGEKKQFCGKYQIKEIRKVKNYAPLLFHYVADVDVRLSSQN